MNFKKHTLIYALIYVTLVGCNSSSSDPETTNEKLVFEVITSEHDRAIPNATDDESTAFSKNINSFALKLYKEQIKKTPNSNQTMSPYSIIYGLSVAYSGASNLSDAYTSIYGSAEHENNLRILNSIASDVESSNTNEDVSFQNVVNYWGQSELLYEQQFIDETFVNLGVDIHLIDLNDNLSLSRITINEWVDTKSTGLVQDIIPQSSLTESTNAVLTNTSLFRAKWLDKFYNVDTSFFTFTGEEKSIPGLNLLGVAKYAQFSTYQVIEIPFSSDQWSFVIFHPQLNSFEDVLSQLDMSFIENAFSEFEGLSVSIRLPEFSTVKSTDIVNLLASLEINDFNSTELNGFDNILIDKSISPTLNHMFHKSNFTVNSGGISTEAIVNESSSQTESIVRTQILVDSPFIYMVKHNKTGLFTHIGQVVNF